MTESHRNGSFYQGVNADKAHLEQVIEDFEEACQSGQCPDLTTFLTGPAGDRQALLIELVHIDLEYRLKAGEHTRVEDYLARFPQLNDPTTLMELLQAEWRFRSRKEPELSLAEYRQRFPEQLAFLSSADHAEKTCPHVTVPWLTETAPPDEALPSTVATEIRYRLVREHARGGLGTILVAEDETLQREVALKFLQPGHTGNAEMRARFLREAAITSQLEHPGIVPIYGVGQAEDGTPLYAMQFIRGQTFHEAVQECPERGYVSVEFRQLLSRFVQVCNTLAYAHSRGVIHRDLKPTNIMLGAYGETLVVDWGLARCVRAAPEESGNLHTHIAGPLTLTDNEPTHLGTGGGLTGGPAFHLPGQGDSKSLSRSWCRLGSWSPLDHDFPPVLVGTPAFMAPEQARGQLDKIGVHTDVHALGATLYFLLTARAPFTGSTLSAVLTLVKRGVVTPPSKLNRVVPAALEAICLKAMAPAPEHRYSSALELARDIERWLADQPVSAWREPWTVRARRWVAHHTTLVSVATVVLLSLTLLGGMATWFQGARERDRLAKERAELRQLRTRERLAQADRAWWTNRLGESARHLRECSPELRGWEWHHLHLRNESALRTLTGHREVVWNVMYHEAGNKLISASLDGTVRIWDPSTGKRLRTLRGHQAQVWGLAVHPEKKLLASGGGRPLVCLWDLQDGKQMGRWDAPGWQVTSLRFAASGGLLIAGCSALRSEMHNRGAVKVWDLKSKTLVFSWECPGSIGDICMSPDGKQLFLACWDCTVINWKLTDLLASNKEKDHPRKPRILNWHHGPVRGVACSPDGRLLASASADRTVCLWDIATGNLQHVLHGHRKQVWGVAFRPDGQQLASCSDDGTVRIWDVSLGAPLYVLRGHQKGIARIAFHPRGHQLASASDDQTLKIWQVNSRAAWSPLVGHRDSTWGVAFSPNGKRLASSGDDGRIILWDCSRKRRILRQWHTLSGSAHVVFSPDGQRVVSAHDDGRVRIWNVSSARVSKTLEGHTDGVWRLAWIRDANSPDVGLLATASWDGTVRVWNTKTGKGRELRGHEGKVWAVASSPDGKVLASGGEDCKVYLWSPSTGKQLQVLEGASTPVRSLALSPDGRYLAVGTAAVARIPTNEPGEILLWDLHTGKEHITLRGHLRSVLDLSFHPDGERLASAGSDATIKLWNVRTGREILTLTHHAGPVHGVAFDPQGERLASTSRDGLVLVWEGKER